MERWGRCASPQQRKALHDIGICRTAALGGHVEQCDSCSQRLVAYNSCRNRHCPKCQSSIGVSLLESLSLLTGLAPWGETNSLDTVDRSLVFDGQRRPFAA